MASTTFMDGLKERSDILHRIALQNEIKCYLAKFIDSDMEKAQVGIRSEGQGGAVPQEVLLDVDTEIDLVIVELKERLTKLDDARMVEDEQAAKKSPKGPDKKDEPPKRKGASGKK